MSVTLPDRAPRPFELVAARRRIAPLIRRTPLASAPWLRTGRGDAVLLKLESLQLTGSYKIRGALNAVLALCERSPGRPRLVTASAGNHGSALAWAARHAGVALTVFTAASAPRAKRDRIAALGATLRAAADYDEAEHAAKAFAQETGAPYISPYDHRDVIAGAGTLALDLLDEVPDVETIVVPVGGGGLVSGIAIAANAASARIRVVGVEVEPSSPFTASLRVTRIEVGPTLADGLAGNLDPDTMTFDIVRALVDAVVVTSEASLGAAVRSLALHEHVIVEGAGAAAVAAIQSGRVAVSGRTVALVTGSNIDMDRFMAVMGPITDSSPTTSPAPRAP
jgi:threonine dehydratase